MESDIFKKSFHKTGKTGEERKRSIGIIISLLLEFLIFCLVIYFARFSNR